MISRETPSLKRPSEFVSRPRIGARRNRGSRLAHDDFALMADQSAPAEGRRGPSRTARPVDKEILLSMHSYLEVSSVRENQTLG